MVIFDTLKTREFDLSLDRWSILDRVPQLYGHQIGDADYAELIAKLRARGTPEAANAAAAIASSRSRDTTAEESLQARDAILRELRDWADLDEKAPSLARLRHRLSGSHQSRRII